MRFIEVSRPQSRFLHQARPALDPRQIALCPRANSVARPRAYLEKDLIDELLIAINASETLNYFAGVMVSEVTGAMKSVNRQLPERALEIAREETVLAFRERVEDGSYNEMMYPIYDKYFAIEDLESIVAFYRSDAGRKYSASFLTMSQETMAAAQEWAVSIGEVASDRAARRMEAEGLSWPD